MPRLVFEFHDPSLPAFRAVFRDPRHVVVAHRTAEVVPALDAVARAVDAGRYAAGYLAYEAAPAFDPAMRVRGGSRMPLLWFGLFDGPEQDPPELEGAPRAVRDRGVASHAAERPDGEAGPGHSRLDWRLEPGQAEYHSAVAAIRSAIAEGRTYQVNLTARMRASFQGDPWALYHRMRRAQGEGYHAFLDLGRHVVMSASPELFFRVDGGRITTRPMKGTRPRGRWPAEDAALKAELSGSGKERAENLMIVDLLRNDVGRVSRTGTVGVPHLMDVERYRTVWQLTSTVTGALRDDAGLVDLFRALFPCGSVTGAPKISTMDVIAGLERAPREVYCGAIGVVRPGGDCAFSVPIRTVWLDRDRARLEYGTGGGVVWDSRPELEYRELLAKSAIVRETWPEFRLIETLRLEEGRFARRDLHLDRLRRSAAYFGFPFPVDEIRDTLETLRAGCGRQRRRVRITLSPTGRVEAVDEPLVGPAGRDTAPAARKGHSDGGPDSTDDDSPGEVFDLASEPVSSTDRFLFHKTTHRAAYDHRRAAAPAALFDVLLFNERGEVTEFTRGNVVVELDGELFTPPVAAGLLAGCLRQELLDRGAIVERTIRIAELDRAARIWLINSVRGWVRVSRRSARLLHPAPAHAAT